ncbi:transcriptional regulator with XRE-family HTH domain [Bradyrhizobium sp. AZCC 1610]|uniref:helix-turn-helix domain-containing protein n=1 Tax=Bradyrhizobium sp. AZCC 1610 TaxID=3117020 RepID=UPI002FF07E30
MNAAVTENMKTPKEIVIEWIEHILDRKKWTGTDLARKSNIAPSTILRLMNDPDHQFVPTLKTLQKIADGSGYPIPRKVMNVLGANKIEPSDTAEEEAEAPRRSFRSSTPRVSTVELRHVSSLPAALQAAANPKRDSYAPAPPQLEGDETAFAFYMPDDTFEPWMKSGTMCYATKRRDPVTGDTIMVTDKNGKTKIRSLMGIDEAGLKLSKSHPVKEDEVMQFDDIAEIAIVVVFVKSM